MKSVWEEKTKNTICKTSMHTYLELTRAARDRHQSEKLSGRFMNNAAEIRHDKFIEIHLSHVITQ